MGSARGQYSSREGSLPAVERRRHRRLTLALPICELEGGELDSSMSTLFTSDVASGGMYFRVPGRICPHRGKSLRFAIEMPAGLGYSTYGGTIRGVGRVVRTVPSGDGWVGVAMEFTSTLSLDF